MLNLIIIIEQIIVIITASSAAIIIAIATIKTNDENGTSLTSVNS